MDGFWNFLRHCFEAMFRVVAKLEMTPNKVLFVIGFIAMIIWVGIMIKIGKEEKHVEGKY